MIWATVSSQSWFYWLYRASPSFFCKEYNQSDFIVDHLVMSMCRVFSCVVGRGCLLWPVHSLGKTLLSFVLLLSVLQGQFHQRPQHRDGPLAPRTLASRGSWGDPLCARTPQCQHPEPQPAGKMLSRHVPASPQPSRATRCAQLPPFRDRGHYSAWGHHRPQRPGDDIHVRCWSVSCVVLEWPWEDTPCPRLEEPQEDNRHWGSSCRALERLWGGLLHAQGQRKSPSKLVGGANSCLESNPIPFRDVQRAQTNLVHTGTQGHHRDWDRNVFEHAYLGRLYFFF